MDYPYLSGKTSIRRRLCDKGIAKMQKYKERSTNKNFRLIQYLVEEQKQNKNKHIKNPLHFYMQWIYNELYTLRDSNPGPID
ncbi:hypothetical protein BFAG_01913 [Bacteroides fragilis 3_1_12]|uniref:Uncharacterized protein n=1 Tax=Bacteroides fragilis 3_1_12 TaxID=457424 RepID=A0ABN0BK38_BACFG|nr:hypothetical protein BFAG_01913 [Bacteroides fragilis 3_1_12]